MTSLSARKFAKTEEREEKGNIFWWYLERTSTNCQQLIRTDNGVERDRNSISQRTPLSSSLKMKPTRKGGGERTTRFWSRIVFRVIQMPTMPLKDFTGNPLAAVGGSTRWCTMAKTPRGTKSRSFLYTRAETDANSPQDNTTGFYLCSLFFPISYCQPPNVASTSHPPGSRRPSHCHMFCRFSWKQGVYWYPLWVVSLFTMM